MVNTNTPGEGISTPEPARKALVVATHNGVFHADDVFAVAAIMLVCPSATVVRTRDPKVLETAAVVIDVGGISDGQVNRFDHHQKGGAGVRANGVPYAAFGLVWAHTGWVWDVLGTLCSNVDDWAHIQRKVDERLVQAIDAADNGFVMEGDVRNTPAFTVSQVISGFNPTWDEDTAFDEAFGAAVTLAKAIITRAVKAAVAEVAAEAAVAAALRDDESRHCTGVLVLEKFVPWTDALLRLDTGRSKFVVFPAETGDWRIQAVPDAPGSFGMRKPLPESWAGLRGADLVEKTGVSDAIFCHNGRFIAGAQSREGIMKMALQAIA